MRSLAASPATRSIAAAMSRGVVVSPGSVIAVRLPQSASVAAAARRIPSRARPGEASATGVWAGTGHGARTPASGSRMIPDRKLEAAAFGRPAAP